MTRPPALSLLALVVASAAIGGTADAQQYSPTTFVIGTYWDAPMSNLTADYSNAAAIQTDSLRLVGMKNAYFNLLTGKSNYPQNAQTENFACDLGTATWLSDYILYLASRTGMSALIANHFWHKYGSFTVPSSPALISHFVQLDAQRRSAFHGYNFFDEPNQPFPSMQSFIKEARTQDPGKLSYINLLPRAAFASDAVYEAYLDALLNPADPLKAPQVASFDSYPFHASFPNGIRTDYFYNHWVMQKKANGRPMWSYPYTIEHSGYISPQAQHFRWMAYCPIAYGAKGLIYFTYIKPNCGNSDACGPFCAGTALVDTLVQPTAKYLLVKEVNWHVAALVGPMVMGSKWLGAWHKSSAPSGEAMRASWLIHPSRTPLVADASDAGTLVGVFRDQAAPATYYVLVVNKNLAPSSTTIALKGNRTGNVLLAPSVVGYNGSTSYTAATTAYNSTTNRTTFALSLSGGEGRLVKVTNVSNPLIAESRTDFDGDGRADLSVKTGTGDWKVDYAANGFGSFDLIRTGTGTGSAIPVPADYDGDGIADIATKDAAGVWRVDYAANGFGSWDLQLPGYGDATWTPLARDFDGDERADLSVTSSTGAWSVDFSANGLGAYDGSYSGYGATSLFSGGDFDGDGKADLCAFYFNSSFKIDYAAGGFGAWNATVSVPLRDDYRVVPADVDGDWKTDIVLQTSGSNGHTIDYARDGFGTSVSVSGNGYGVQNSVAVPADYDGDGASDLSVKSNTGSWLIDYVAGGLGSWNATYVGYGDVTNVPQFRVRGEGEEPAVDESQLDWAVLSNPTRSAPTVRLRLTVEASVRLAVYDVRGRQVALLHDGRLSPGSHEIRWAGFETGSGDRPPGVYFVRLEAGAQRRTLKLVLVD